MEQLCLLGLLGLGVNTYFSVQINFDLQALTAIQFDNNFDSFSFGSDSFGDFANTWKNSLNVFNSLKIIDSQKVVCLWIELYCNCISLQSISRYTAFLTHYIHCKLVKYNFLCWDFGDCSNEDRTQSENRYFLPSPII